MFPLRIVNVASVSISRAVVELLFITLHRSPLIFRPPRTKLALYIMHLHTHETGTWIAIKNSLARIDHLEELSFRMVISPFHIDLS